MNRKCILFFQEIQMKTLNKNHVEIAGAFTPNVSQYWWNVIQNRFCSIFHLRSTLCQTSWSIYSHWNKTSTNKDTIIYFVVKNTNYKKKTRNTDKDTFAGMARLSADMEQLRVWRGRFSCHQPKTLVDPRSPTIQQVLYQLIEMQS